MARQIGEDVIIYTLGSEFIPTALLVDRCIIHANAVIGCDGFGYGPMKMDIMSR